MPAASESDIESLISRMLAEDVGSGDVTAALIDAATELAATVITREPMTLAGRPYAAAVFARVDSAINVDWQAQDGDELAAGAILFRLSGPARAILTAERTALNLLQTLSSTATITAQYVRAVAGTGCRVLDTRKTLPGLRDAQKYAVRCGGGHNHRMGLYDAVLIKENHIHSAGSIAAAVRRSRNLHPTLPIEVEVESLDELDTALDAGVDRVLLDNFSENELAAAVATNRQHRTPAELEASGNVELDTIAAIAATGVDYISVGALTKHVRAIDLSMRFDESG